MPLSPVFLRKLVFEDLLVHRPEHSEREGSSRSATKGLEEAALGSAEGGSGRTQALSILMLPHLPKSGQRQPEAEEQKHNFHQKDVSCPRMSVSLKLVLHPLGWEHPQIQNGESLEGQLSLWKNPRSQGPFLPTHPAQQPELVSTSPQKLPVQPSREETEIAHAGAGWGSGGRTALIIDSW